MNRHTLLPTPLLLAGALLLAGCHHNDAPQLATRQDTLSWAMGTNIGLSLQQMGVLNLDNDLVLQALEHTLNGGQQLLNDSVMMDAMLSLGATQQMEAMRQASMQEEQVQRMQEEYFAKLVKERPQVKKHPAGFYYEVLQTGKGRTPRYGERVSFDYRSYLMFTGEAWDQTYGKRDPIIHTVGNPMFKGLIEGMQLMQAGSIFRFYFPYQLAFGPQGSGEIPGYTPFIYEIEIHNIFDD